MGRSSRGEYNAISIYCCPKAVLHKSLNSEFMCTIGPDFEFLPKPWALSSACKWSTFCLQVRKSETLSFQGNFFCIQCQFVLKEKELFQNFVNFFILKVDGSVCVICENFLLYLNQNYNWKSAKALKQVGKKSTFYSEGLLRLLLIIKLLTSSPQSKIQFLQALHEVGRVSELGHLKLAPVSWGGSAVIGAVKILALPWRKKCLNYHFWEWIITFWVNVH